MTTTTTAAVDARKGISPGEVSAVHAKAVELGKLVLRMTTTSGSGHPSSALALCHIVVELMHRRMRYDPQDPWNPANDRLVLSVGHAVPIIYAAYADLGGVVGRNRTDARRLTTDDLTALRELNSVLDGHPNPAEGFPFFDAATGSLGQGLSVAAGLALAARLGCIDKRIYCIVGDGESREGQVWEAADFIVDQHLNNVCAVFSCNGHGQAGPVSAQQSADALAAKLAAFNWKVFRADGHDPKSLAAAFDHAETCDRPAAIVAATVKGWGVDLMIGKNYHGKPLDDAELKKGLEQIEAIGQRLGALPSLPTEPRKPGKIPPQPKPRPIALPPFQDGLKRAGLESALDKKKLATRRAFGAALLALGEADPRVVSLDGDVSNSTFADLFARHFGSRFFECKIGEQNMISAAAGCAAAGLIPFASSFGKFIARAADQIDMAVISRANIKIVGSHCGVSLGADGPSQMAVSDVAYFRSLTRVDNGCGGIGCHVFQPADAVCAYRLTELMADIDGMCYMRTHRPDAPFVYPMDERFELRGCKRLRTGRHLTLASCGYMLHTVRAAATKLAEEGVECNVFDAYTFPLDAGPILDAAKESGGAILTVEDNYEGGLRSELAEAAAERGDVRVVGLTARRIPKSAKEADEVFNYTGVSLEQIITSAKALAGR
jgi:transketolase